MIIKYWNDYIGNSLESLVLLDWLADTRRTEITDMEILDGLGITRISNLRKHKPLSVPLHDVSHPEDPPDYCAMIWNAIYVLLDVGSLIAQCRLEGTVFLDELYGDDFEPSPYEMSIVGTALGLKYLRRNISDFILHPDQYALKDMMPKEELQELSKAARVLYVDLFRDADA